MGILDFLFKKERPEEVQTPIEPLPSQQLEDNEYGPVCEYCKDRIFSHEKRTKMAGKKFHKKCFKQMKKDAKKMAFG